MDKSLQWSRWVIEAYGNGKGKDQKSFLQERVQSVIWENNENFVKSFSTLDKDLDEKYSEHQKVKKLLQCIQMPDMEVVAQKLVIALQYTNDFSGICNYFLAQVSHLHGRA
jgi:hypothetical protein